MHPTYTAIMIDVSFPSVNGKRCCTNDHTQPNEPVRAILDDFPTARNDNRSSSRSSKVSRVLAHAYHPYYAAALCHQCRP